MAKLNKWEDLRYPERRDLNISMHLTIKKNAGRLKFEQTKDPRSENYTISLEEADEFFSYIINHLAINKSFIDFPLKTDVFVNWDIYKEQNKHVIS